MELIRVVVADDHMVVREGLRGILELAADMQVVAEAGNGCEAVAICEEHQPDVVLMDLRMPIMDGLQATREIKSRWPQIEVVILTTYHEDEDIIQALRWGARGYLLKDTGRDRLYEAVRAAAQGTSLLAPEILAAVVSHLSPAASIPTAEDAAVENPLSEREHEVLAAMANGERNKEIAARLGIAERTVKAHVASLFAKLGATSRGEAIAIAMRRGIIGK